MRAFLEDWLGASWRTKALGLGLMLLGTLGIFVGALMTLWSVLKEAGAAVIAQGVTMLLAGVGFVLARDHAASEQAHAKQEDEIQATKAEAKQEARQEAREVAKEVVSQEIKR